MQALRVEGDDSNPGYPKYDAWHRIVRRWPSGANCCHLEVYGQTKGALMNAKVADRRVKLDVQNLLFEGRDPIDEKQPGTACLVGLIPSFRAHQPADHRAGLRHSE
jgi:hypothetical protein